MGSTPAILGAFVPGWAHEGAIDPFQESCWPTGYP